MSVKIQLKHSSVNGKAPQPSDLDAGELALNTNAASPAAYIKDSAGAIVKLAGAGSASTPDASETVKGIAEIATKAEVTAGTDDATIVTPLKLKQAVDALPPGTTVSATAPATPENGQAWFDSTNAALKVWDGTAWQTSTPVVWTRGGGGLIPTTAADNVFVGGTAAAPNISLKADGSATFASDVKIGGTLPAAPKISLNASSGGINFDGILTGNFTDFYAPLGNITKAAFLRGDTVLLQVKTVMYFTGILIRQAILKSAA